MTLPTRAAPAAAGTGGRLLVVDDDQAMCETLAACLVRRGFAVARRTSALDALALLDIQDFDAILTDLNMPGMDGLALCERVAVIRPGLPVILTTAFGTPAISAAALEAGVFGIIMKPFDIEVLRHAIGRAVAFGRAARSSRIPR